MVMEALLGIDIGAAGCKVVLYDFAGHPLISANEGYSMSHPKPGWVEEDADEWWKKTAACIRRVVDSRFTSTRIVGIAVSCTNALVVVDRSGKPLRPAIMQLDQRSLDQIESLKQRVGSGLFFKIAKNRLAMNYFSAPVILWIKEHEPEIFENTHRFLAPSGFIVQRLTGCYSIDFSRASTTLLLDSIKRTWSEDLLYATGLPRNKLPELYESWDVVGSTTSSVATLTGLPAGIPVVAGCVDTLSATIGMGVFKSGEAGITMGTVARLSTVLDQPPSDDRFVNCSHVLPSHWLAMAPISGAGSSLRWFRDVLGQNEVDQAKKNGENSFDMLLDQARKSKPGASGLLYVPYISGECSPHWDPNARAIFFGLGLYHTRGDMIRSILVGVAFSMRENLEIIEGIIGLPVKELRTGGGGARSKLWNQIIADILNRKIVGLQVRETESLGAALLAGIGTNVFSNLEEACTKGVTLKEEWTPRSQDTDLYNELYSLYGQLYKDLHPCFNKLQEWVHRGSRLAAIPKI